MPQNVLIEDLREILTNEELIRLFDGKSVLVTGGSGLIGSMLIRVFDKAKKDFGIDIRIFCHARDEIKTQAVLGEIIERIDVIYSNSFELDIVCDYIFHTASPTSSKYFIQHPVETIDVMVFGTKSMLELAKLNSATLVYLSSMEEYGVPYTPGEVITEDKVGIINHLAPRSCYPESKRMCECMCAAYTSEYDVDTKIVRLAQTFGAGIPISDNRLPMQFANSVIEGKDIILHTEGKSVSNYCYTTDAISGILTIATRGHSGEAYNVCNDTETRSIYEIAVLVAEKVANGAIKVVKDIPDNTDFGYAPDNTMRLSSGKLETLGWSPKVNIESGYERLIEYLRNETYAYL